MKITQKDIAQHAGVSVATVSNVLRGKGRVSDEVEAKILNIADELGYEREARVDFDMIGLISCKAPYVHENKLDNSLTQTISYFTHEAINGIESEIKGQCHLIYHVLNSFDYDGQLPEMIKQRLIKGLLVVGGSINDQFILKLEKTGIPMVLLFTELFNANIDSILVNNQQGAYQAAKHLLDLGHKKIGFINGWTVTHTSEMKLQGFKKALTDGGITYDDSLYEIGDFTKAGGEKAMKKLLEKEKPPTAVFVADDLMAVGAIRACREKGFNIPEDIALVGFGNSPLAADMYPALTTIDAHQAKIGKIAARRLLEIIKTGETESYTTKVSTRLVCRDSCGCEN